MVVCIYLFSIQEQSVSRVEKLAIGRRIVKFKKKISKTSKGNADKNDKNETLNRKFINVKLNNKIIWMLLDTGRDISITDEKT